MIDHINEPAFFFIILIVLFVIIFLRYVGLALLYEYIFKKKLKAKYSRREIERRKREKAQLLKELKWSAFSSLIFAFFAAGMLWMWRNGYNHIYEDTQLYGWIYYFSSIFLVMIVHETYYYWLHRLMHHPALYRLVHKVHHDSTYTTVYTSFSFHPLEAFLQAAFLPVLVIMMPVHYSVIFILLILMTISSVINHSRIEIYPRGFNRNMIGKWLIGATHHHLHHKRFNYNYGLYFTFWDKWMGTESEEYNRLFEEKVGE